MPPIVALPPSVLTPHPQNPRPRPTESEVSELRASIEAHGQQQPCVVRPVGENGSKQYQVVIGHRRAFVGRLLGREVPCLVEDLDDDEALALMLSDNRVRTDPDPFMESKAVDALLKKAVHTLRSVADLLGKPPKWVAQRANLQTLTKKSREVLARAGWPVSWLEDWSRLSPEVQDAEVERVSWVRDGRQLQGIVSKYFRLLGKAPWDLEDAALLPKAGACASCPKQSMACPGLFSDGEVKDVRKATCRDALCWTAKADAHAAQSLASLRSEQPDLVLIAGDVDAKHLPCLKDQKVLDSWTVEDSKKSAKGALPAAKVTVDGRVTRVWIQAPRASHGPGNGRKPRKTAAEMSPKERLEASKARYAKRRAARVLELLRESIENFPAPDLKVVMGLCVAYRLPATVDSGVLKARRTRYALEGKEWAAEAWERLKRPVVEALRWFSDESMERARAEGAWLAGVLQVNLAALEAKARDEIRDPAWWGETGRK
ncbi:MAG: ParB/RepB/Spo0J family partition protein [Planctomycetes bacterium]|nr:ParB/RepB/Spo0J family partition protein [Planctomycetota bacterium]